MPNSNHTASLQAFLYKSQLEFSHELGYNFDNDCCEDLHLSDLKSIVEKQKEMK